jgi:hypothetical protein
MRNIERAANLYDAQFAVARGSGSRNWVAAVEQLLQSGRVVTTWGAAEMKCWDRCAANSRVFAQLTLAMLELCSGLAWAPSAVRGRNYVATAEGTQADARIPNAAKQRHASQQQSHVAERVLPYNGTSFIGGCHKIDLMFAALLSERIRQTGRMLENMASESFLVFC